MSVLVRAGQLDHVHLCVRDRAASIDWYARVLDLRVLGPTHGDLADDHPVFLAPADTPTSHCLSLFVGQSATGGDRNVAFSVTAPAFLSFLAHLPDPEVISQRGGPLGVEHVNDYGPAMTLDFIDPDGNELELVTYDSAPVRAGIAQ